jgi:hypothetical protein
VLLKQSTGLPLSASLLALLQQQGGDASCFDEWMGLAAEWDLYVKRDKEAGSLLLHLLKTSGECSAAASSVRVSCAGRHCTAGAVLAVGAFPAVAHPDSC